VYATRIEERGGSMCKVTPFPSIDIDNELNKVIYTQPQFWLVIMRGKNSLHPYAARSMHIGSLIPSGEKYRLDNRAKRIEL
jgi:hypothetical protein